MQNVGAWREATVGDLSYRVDAFSEELRFRSRRLAELCGRQGTGASEERRLRETLIELQDQYDELVAVEEELRAQVEESSALAARACEDRERAIGLFESSPDAALETDADGVIRNANRRARALFGRGLGPSKPGLGPLRGKPLSLLVDERDRRALREVLGDLARVEDASLDFRLTLPMMKPMSIAARVCTTGDKGLLWTMRVRPTTDDGPLEKLVAHRTAELERKLRDKDEIADRDRACLRQAERGARAKDGFIAMLAHDLRGPIDAVLGWAALLRRERLDTTARDRALNIIERSTRFQLGMVNELLDVSRLLADKMRVEVRPVDLASVVRRVHEGLLPTAESNRIALRFPGTPPSCPVFGDPQRLEEIATKLVTNALKSTPHGGTVEVTLAHVEGGRVRLQVRDDGKGVSADHLPRLFDCFGQESDGEEARSGLGLGLFVVRQLVELHEGSVEAESEGIGRGATFSVYLPLREIAAQVLVVDDDDEPRTS